VSVRRAGEATQGGKGSAESSPDPWLTDLMAGCNALLRLCQYQKQNREMSLDSGGGSLKIDS